MSARTLPPLSDKADRNPHEVSGDEAPPRQSRIQHSRGGGHRSGSRGAGTSEHPDGQPQRQQGPRGIARTSAT